MRKAASFALEILSLMVAVWLLVNHGGGEGSPFWPATATAAPAPAPATLGRF